MNHIVENVLHGQELDIRYTYGRVVIPPFKGLPICIYICIYIYMYIYIIYIHIYSKITVG